MMALRLSSLIILICCLGLFFLRSDLIPSPLLRMDHRTLFNGCRTVRSTLRASASFRLAFPFLRDSSGGKVTMLWFVSVCMFVSVCLIYRVCPCVW